MMKATISELHWLSSPGEIAPMSLLTYNDARPWAKSIREKVANREMPARGSSTLS